MAQILRLPFDPPADLEYRPGLSFPLLPLRADNPNKTPPALRKCLGPCQASQLIRKWLESNPTSRQSGTSKKTIKQTSEQMLVALCCHATHSSQRTVLEMVPGNLSRRHVAALGMEALNARHCVSSNMGKYWNDLGVSNKTPLCGQERLSMFGSFLSNRLTSVATAASSVSS
jgi:hypothetical protein